ncbi:MAG: PLP-dependent aspartate aminotransferase family protein [Bacteroidota bacterium]
MEDYSHILTHLGEDRDQVQGAVNPPIYYSSNFAFNTVEEMRHALTHEMDVPFYTRGHNPTVAVLRKKIAALEKAEECLLFGSGSAAMAAAVMSQVQQGDHVICVQKPYSWTGKLLAKLLSRYGVTHTFIDGREARNYEAAIQKNTTLLILESPNSMTFELQDLKAVATIAREHGIRTICDNSYASPINQNPIALGIDIVIHSATKYLSGHSDVVAGALCTSRDIAEHIFQSEYMTLGAILSPHDAWLLLRGLRTLPLRMQRVAETTPKIVEYLSTHPLVDKVYYPFLRENEQYELAMQQQKMPGGQFSIELKADSMEQVDLFCNSLQTFLMACSWGGYESLIFPISTLYQSANYAETTLPWNFIRFYVGLEDPTYLIADLENAFQAVSKLPLV